MNKREGWKSSLPRKSFIAEEERMCNEEPCNGMCNLHECRPITVRSSSSSLFADLKID
jgi:hypothetical protein